jgi:hypothetical protein
MIQRGSRARFLFETPQPVRIGRKERRQDLDRNVAAEPYIFRAEDLTHTAGTDRGEDLVRPEFASGSDGHRKLRIIAALPRETRRAPDRDLHVFV